MDKSLAELHEEPIAAIKDLKEEIQNPGAIDAGAAIAVDDFRVSAEDLAGAMARILLYVDETVVEVIEEIEYDQDGQPIQQPVERKCEFFGYMPISEGCEAISALSIQELMGHQGYTLSDLSELTEIDEQSLSKILHYGTCTSEEALKIAYALDVQPNEIEI